MLLEFINNMENTTNSNKKIRNVYYHNLARFDGIILLRYYADRINIHKIKTQIINHRIYQIKIFKYGKFLYRMRDSLTILPASLASLGKLYVQI